MAQQEAPLPSFQFGGISTSGHPLRRTPSSATVCTDFRIMPGGYLRLRGGRKLRRGLNSGTFRRIFGVQLASGIANPWVHMVAIDNGDGTSQWSTLGVTNFGYELNQLEAISRTKGYQEPGFPAASIVRDRVVFYNGLGSFDSGGSRPPFSSWDGQTLRYFGLDAPQLNGASAPAISLGTGGANNNQILFSKNFYVGVYNSATGHFSNGISIGSITNSDANFGKIPMVGDLAVAGLNHLKIPYHTVNWFGTNVNPDKSELQVVFYVTGDGGQVPFLLIKPDGSGPVSVGIGTDTCSLSFANASPDGFILDPSSEMPIANFPPRAMSCLCYSSGRLYGALAPGAYSYNWFSPSSSFNYNINPSELTAVVWSATADDSTDHAFLGVPEESWPLGNRKYTPNGQRPLWLIQAQDGTDRTIVITFSGTFFLNETADGLHVWENISTTSGLWDPRSFAVTPYGYVWLNQLKQLVILPPGSSQVQILSAGYSDLFSNVTSSTPADYISDPIHKIDRYQIWLGDGTSVIHDFVIGQSYKATNQQVTAAASLIDLQRNIHHIITIGSSLYTHEVNPDHLSNPAIPSIPVSDETYVGPIPGVPPFSSPSDFREVNGVWIGQWTDLGDPTARKEFSALQFMGDGADSPQLGIPPASLSWYADLASERFILTHYKTTQIATDNLYEAKVVRGARRWYKLQINLNGHSQDPRATYVSTASTGDLDLNPYGVIWAAMPSMSNSGNR